MMIEELPILRRAHAMQVLAAAGIIDPALERAFGETARERFLGPGPWSVVRWGGAYRRTPSDDPVYLYTDDLVAIDAARNLNNGQPSFLASLIHAAAVKPGDHAVHVGTGTGYYTAILSHLAGPAGHVTGIEVDSGLAERCRANLPEAEIVAGDGGRTDFAPADVILVNAGAARPADLWLDRLKDGGRLVLPLTTDKGFTWPVAVAESTNPQGAVFVVTRQGHDYHARRISATRIFPCAGLRDPADERRLAAAFAGGDGRSVTRLHRRNAEPGETCWLEGDGWCMT